MSESREAASVAVLVLNLNGARFLDECIRSLLRNVASAFDTYLIDNGSTDASVEIVRTRYPFVRIIEHGENLGYAGAYDRAIRTLEYKYIVLLNNDTRVEDGWLEALVNEAQRNDKVAACGSKVLMSRDPSVIDHAGGMLTAIGSGLDRGKWKRDSGEYNQTEEVGFGCGCSLLIRRSAYLEVGGFDPGYFIYHEDVDLCWKLRLFGYSVLYVPGSVVYHHLGGGEVQSVEHPWKTYLCQKNRLANLVKNTTPERLLAAILVSTVYDVVRLARFAILGRWDLLRMLVKGYSHTIMNLARLWAGRRFVQSHRSVSGREMGSFFARVIPAARDYRRLRTPPDM